MKDVEVTEPVSAGNLQVFGLRSKNAEPRTYSVLDEALAAGTVEVTEVDESGDVPNLKVTNTGDTWVFLMAGEMLDGAKQNRVLNVSMMVGEHSETVVPVSCVEQGRWGYRSRRFRGSGSSSHSRLRRKMSRDAVVFYRKSGRPGSKQGEIWREVARKLRSLGSVSKSDSLHQAYLDRDASLEETFGSLTVPDDCTGVVFAIGGRISGVDLFDRSDTLQKLFPKLVNSYAIDAIESFDDSDPIDQASVTRWLNWAHEAQSTRFKSPGLGDDVRIEGIAHIGACLLVDNRPVHAELFPSEELTA